MSNDEHEPAVPGQQPFSPFGATMLVDPAALAKESLDFGLTETANVSTLPKRFGRYIVNSVLARGGMGIIYHCFDPEYERDIALKALLTDHAQKPDFLRRFQSEVLITSHLEHPGIVPVYEKGNLDDGRPYFTMRVIPGETLDKLIADAERPRLLKVFERICQGVAYAHAKGVVHRDLKPENVIVGPYGTVKILDWGVAKIMPHSPLARYGNAETEAARELDIGTVATDHAHTINGFVMGTPAYLSPEQAIGDIERIDTYSDVFGLGAILCAILTGKPPYASPSGRANLEMARKAKLSDAVQRLQCCGAEQALISLALRCLSPDPAKRPANAEVLTAEFTAYLESDLRRAERDLVRFFELSLDLFCIAGVDGYFKRVNGNFSRILGYEMADMVSQPFMDFVHPDDRPKTESVMSGLIHGSNVVGFRNRYRDIRGVYHDLEWVAQAATEDGLIFAVARQIVEAQKPGLPDN